MALSQFTPIYCGRSDAEVEIRSKKYGKEFNGPSNNQLDRVANPDDYYEPLDHNHAITIEWKRQLGGMLQREMRPQQAQHPWFLMFFPENYRLYKHNKETRDHTDAYLYGYPQGRKKRFRSAQEFFPHFLWLMEGKSEDYGDCACKNCAGDWVHKIEPLPGRLGFVPAAKEVQPVKKEQTPIKKEPILPKKESITLSPKVVIPQKFPQQATTLPRPPTKTPAPNNSASAVPRTPAQPTPTPLPPLKSKEQEIDSQYRRYIYRIGELVWFNRGTAWGLALITKRDTIIQQGNRSAARYLVQPLSHPLRHPESKILTSDDVLRPWLAWSAPGPTHRALTGKNYSSIDWKAVIAGHFGTGDAEVDGSILAAKQIDDSFSLVSPLTNNTLTTGERTYLALFLGGEKIYVREPVRLRINQGQDVLVIYEIVEKLKPNSTNITSASVHVIGDIYRFVTLPYDPSNAKLFANAHLPERMKADLEFRNSVTVPIKKVHSFWKLMQNGSRVSIQDLKGRWYESSILLPILRSNAVFASEVQRGEVSDVGEWINGRGDANGAAGKTGSRFRERLEAVGRAVPIGVRLGGPEESGEGGVETERASSNPQVQQASNTPRPAVSQSVNQGPRRESLHAQGTEQSIRPGQGDLPQHMDVDR
ncbi:uncharacterized protein KY384_007722 [Bacidia gigantensis]|uniref:uncharacterized protein n=1 Tax=Bacidia gigantensis TaxID=2732470 RepID=UPI001D03E1E8|nr:uncharacterized protein KY384_007722 [Bacidia gigantensis]KAG8527569.1 hypothetical protein KY384_007722 [Bacidia gigantensis]